MKMTFFAFAGSSGGRGSKSYFRSRTDGGVAPNAVFICSRELNAIAPNPTAASCSTSLRVRCLFMADFLRYLVIRLITVQERIGPKHRLHEQAEALFRIRFRRDRLHRDCPLACRGCPVIGLVV